MKQSFNFLRASRSIAKTGLSGRIFFRFKRWSENEVEKSVEKVVPKGPQMDPKSRPKSTERVFWRGSKEGPKKGTLSRTGKSEILLLFTTL